jgi:hypothetical protein
MPAADDDDIHRERAAVGEVHRALVDTGARPSGVDGETERLDVAPQYGPATLVDLHRHEPGREFHDMSGESEVSQRIGGLEPEEATSQHCAGAARRKALERLEIIDGAVDEALLRPGNGGTNGLDPVATTKTSYGIRR